MPPISSSIFFHNYYGNDPEWIAYFSREVTYPCNLFYNGVAGSYHRLVQNSSCSQNGPQEGPIRLTYRESTNRGKDIGGKLVLMDAYMRMGVKSDFILLLHDKHSPYHSNSDQWRKDLFRVAEGQHREKVVEAFKKPRVGIVASAGTIRNETDNDHGRDHYTDSPFIQSLLNAFGIRPPHLQYVAGTMFWVRASVFEDFFRQYPPLLIRSRLEGGNIMDDVPTHTHAWERMLCWLVTSRGYQIMGV